MISTKFSQYNTSVYRQSTKKFDVDYMTKPYLVQIKMLFGNSDYVILSIASSLVIQCFFIFPTMLEQILQPLQFKDESIEMVGILYFLSGIFGGIFFSQGIQKKKVREVRAAIVACFMMLIGFGVFHYVVLTKVTWPVYVTASSCGFFNIGFF